jgi:hypothetical protein
MTASLLLSLNYFKREHYGGYMDIEHPFKPEVDWKIAVSRRFSDPSVEELYRNVIYPVLQSEGLVLECQFADNDPKLINYWTNRIKLILELSDIHILLDIARSGSMDLEFHHSRMLRGRHRREHRRPALVVNFGFTNIFLLALIPATSIIIKTGHGKDSYSSLRHLGNVFLPHELSIDERQKKLRRIINEAKKSHTKRLNREIYWFLKFSSLTGLQKDWVEQAHKKLHLLAKRLLDCKNITELKSFIAEEKFSGSQIEVTEESVISVSNERDDWQLKLLSGELQPPKSMMETYHILKEYNSYNLARAMGDTDLAYSQVIRFFTSIQAISMTLGIHWKIPRLRKARKAS